MSIQNISGERGAPCGEYRVEPTIILAERIITRLRALKRHDENFVGGEEHDPLSLYGLRASVAEPRAAAEKLPTVQEVRDRRRGAVSAPAAEPAMTPAERDNDPVSVCTRCGAEPAIVETPRVAWCQGCHFLWHVGVSWGWHGDSAADELEFNRNLPALHADDHDGTHEPQPPVVP